MFTNNARPVADVFLLCADLDQRLGFSRGLVSGQGLSCRIVELRLSHLRLLNLDQRLM
jgi:hypothetical protein